MRTLVAALLLAGCNGCAQTPPSPPVGPTPPPVHADAGSPCAAACQAASTLCDRPALTVEQCTTTCVEGMAQLSGKTATPMCLAAELMCSSKEWCQ